MPFEPVGKIDLSAPPSAEVTARVAALTPAPPPIAPATPAEARSRLDVLIGDKDFGAKLLSGSADAKAEWNRLQELAAKADPVAAGPPPPDQIFSTTVNGQLPP